MADPVTTITATVIANLAFKKFIESGTEKLAEKFTEAAISRMDELRQKIWEKLQGKSEKVDEALAKVKQGESEALNTIVKNLDVVMDENPEFAAEVQAIAQEINADKLVDQSQMNQHNSGNATAFQAKIDGGINHLVIKK